MPDLLDVTTRNIALSQSPLEFFTSGAGDWEIWDRFLTVNGKQAYHLGNVCGTCRFLFERMEGANTGIEVDELTALLAAGLNNLSEEVVEKLAQLLPASNYIVALLRLKPQLVQLGGESDYFAVEQVENEDGVDPFWGLPHYPKVPYYRVVGRSRVKVPQGEAFDFIVPMIPESMLERERIGFYERSLNDDFAPTAVALSLLDVKGPAYSGTDHWCLAHYVIDGHHKVAAAARADRELTLIAFIAVDHGISSKEQVDIVLKTFTQSV